MPRGSTTASDDRFVAVSDRQGRRRLELVGEAAELAGRRLLEARPHVARELQEPEAEGVATVRAAHDEPLVAQRAEEPVDAGSVRPHHLGELGDGEPVGVLGEHREHAEATFERLRSARGSSGRYALGCHSGDDTFVSLSVMCSPSTNIVLR